MITTISEVVPGEKFKILERVDTKTGKEIYSKEIYKLRTILIAGNCTKTGMVHLSVSTDPFWFWCIHGSTKVFLIP